MKATKYTALSAAWDVNLDTGTFLSPGKDSEQNQIVVLGHRIKDGEISADIIPIAGERDPNFGYELRECALLFRYIDREHFYLAGIGGFGRQFYIAKVSSSEWRMLDGCGLATSVIAGERYRLKVEFRSDRMTLFNNDVPILNTIDGTYFSGFCGLRTNKTQAKFENVELQWVRPKCFVIMPFEAELKFVYSVIKETIEQQDIECQRADERFISQPIMEDVKNQISSADLVVVDFTNKNPNVYFEAGLADAWKKKWIVLAQSTNDLAFDVQHVRTIMYSNKMGADITLKENLIKALKQILGKATDIET
jgi:hypothetical protein